MTSRLTNVPVMPSGRKATVARFFFQLAVVLLLIGLGATALAFWSESRAVAAAAWRDPSAGVRPEAVATDLALLRLAGASDERVLALAMEMDELETLRSVLVFSGDLGDRERTNGWLWLAQRYSQAGQREQAALAFRLAGDGAILGVGLPDWSRTEILVAVGRQLLPLFDRIGAKFFLGQAAVIGARSSSLTDFQRRSLLERLVPSILEAGGEREDWRDLAAAVENDAAGDTFRSPAGPSGLGLDGVLVGDALSVQARDARRAVAAEWLAATSAGYASSDAALSDTASAPPRDALGQTKTDGESREQLRQALLTEDAALDRFAAAGLVADESALAAHEVWLRWLLLKRRVAGGGFGSGLVPEWERRREEIDADLSKAWTRWLTLQTGEGGAGSISDWNLPPAVARSALMAAYWGLFPDAPVEELVSMLQRADDTGRLHLAVLLPGTPPVVGWSE
jgi:hypothetical protein